MMHENSFVLNLQQPVSQRAVDHMFGCTSFMCGTSFHGVQPIQTRRTTRFTKSINLKSRPGSESRKCIRIFSVTRVLDSFEVTEDDRAFDQQ